MSEFKLPTYALPAKFRPFLFECPLIDRGLLQRVVEMLDAPVYQMATTTRRNAARDLLGEVYALREKQGVHGRLTNPRYGNEVIESTKAVYEWLRFLVNAADAAGPDKDAAHDLTADEDDKAATASAREKTAAKADKIAATTVVYELHPGGDDQITEVFRAMAEGFNVLSAGRLTKEMVDKIPERLRHMFRPVNQPAVPKNPLPNKKVGKAHPVPGHPAIRVSLVSGHRVFSKSLDEVDDVAIDMLHWTGNEIRAVGAYLNEEI